LVVWKAGGTESRPELYFDDIDMVWIDKTILDNALGGKYTLSDLVKAAKKYIK
jgi:hypothetical protein